MPFWILNEVTYPAGLLSCFHAALSNFGQEKGSSALTNFAIVVSHDICTCALLSLQGHFGDLDPYHRISLLAFWRVLLEMLIFTHS